ncbi:uncharacterized protein LOC129313068 [Prosopis cineraria]|uniref:uncharacterized protein LOC129313068 n=1 Tax=Prosopis cineraria TaxID=364024 RepID=UPI00240F44B6|nr:uncharacterized protein LOC129313068 [Prosopis cineraria]
MKDRVLSSAAHGMQAKSSTTHSGARKEHAITSNKEKKSVYSKFGFGEEKVKNGIDQQRRGSSKLSAFESTQCGFRCASPVVEKTLYIDYVHKDKLHSNSSSSAMKGQTNHTWDPFKTSIKDSGNCKKISIDPKISESLDLPFNCCPCRSSNDVQMHVTNHSNKLELEKQSSTEPLEHEIDSAKNSAISNPQVAQCSKTLSDNLVIRNQENFDGPVQNPASWRGSRLAGDVEVDLKSLVAARSTDQECSKRVSDGRTDLENQCQKRLGNQDEINLRLSFSLLSPKAPSDSWLKRTLPIISSSNAIAKIPACCRITNTATHDPKWERIVRSSEELLTPIPED